MVQIMMKNPEENMSARTILRGSGTWSFARMGMGMIIMQRSDLTKHFSVWLLKGEGLVAYKTLKVAIST